MNWYIAICSLVAGFALGALLMKRADLGPVFEIQADLKVLIDAFLRMQNEYGRHYQRLFDVNRQILVSLIGRKPDMSVLIDDEPSDEEEGT